MAFIAPMQNQGGGPALVTKQASQPSAFRPNNQPNQQQMLAQALRGRNAMPQQQQFTEEEQAIHVPSWNSPKLG